MTQEQEELLRLTNLIIEAEAEKDWVKIQKIREAIQSKDPNNTALDILSTTEWTDIKILIEQLQKNIDIL